MITFDKRGHRTQRPSAYRPGRKSGFSLVELMIGLALGALVLLSIFSVFTTLTRSYTVQNVAAEVQQTARVGLDFIARDVRMAGLDPRRSAGAAIEEIAPSGQKLRFSADLCNLPIGSSGSCENPTPNGSTEDKSERVTYIYDPAGGTLRRCLYEDSAAVAPNAVVTVPGRTSCTTFMSNVVPNPDGTPLFEFYDDDSAGPNKITQNEDRSKIRTVRITLTVAEPAGLNRVVNRTYSTRIRCRNIGL